METNSEMKLYHGCATRYSYGPRIPIKKGDPRYHPTSDPFWKKIDSSKSEDKQVIRGLTIVSNIVDEYDTAFFDDQGHIKIKPKGISPS